MTNHKNTPKKNNRPQDYPTDGRATPAEAARFLGVSTSLLRTLAREGRIETTYAGTHRRYDWQTLHKIKRGEVDVPGLTSPAIVNS